MIKRLFFITLFLVLLATGWLWQRYQQVINDVIVTQRGLVVEVVKGDSLNVIARKLSEQLDGFDPYAFKLLAYHQKVVNLLKAGEYELTPGMKLPDILASLVAGKSKQYSITFPEGWTFRQIRQAIADNPNIKQTLTGMDPQQIMQRLGSETLHPEGLFFPETYFFEKNSSDFALLKRAYRKMQSVLEQEWNDREKALPLKNRYQALILASIIEKETGVGGERKPIAGVFIRRLRKGMLLQTDPTVIYGMGERYQGNIRRRDLRTPTPYNTYIIKGLPPTPIAMPGQAAVHAALHPADGKSLYFVARGDGSHQFSATLREHNNAVNKYQRRR